VQLGHGRYQQRIQATVTGRTPHIAVELASDKEETNRILSMLGLPVPKQELVQSQAQAIRAARRIGFPVVTKPYDGNHGRGISIGLKTEDEVAAGYAVAREHARSVIVESFVDGDDHRLLVVNGQLVAATRRTPGHVVGDDRHTIAELVEIVNQDARRGVGHEKVLTRLELDAQAHKMLEKAGLAAESVPAAGQVVYLRATANLSTGGTATDVTDVIHPDNREMAERAVRAIGLDVGGVDFLTTNIAESYRSIGGAICEVNAAPGFRMHVAPSDGTPRDVAGPVIDMLFPPGAPSRVPIAAVTGTNGKTTTARMLAHVTKMAGYTPGLTTTDGVYIDLQRTVTGDMTGPVSARMVLSDPQIDIAVLETARGGLLRAGMGVEEVNVGAVLNVQSDHLGLKGIDTLEQLAEVKRIVVEVATDCAVLNADDPLVVRMSAHTEAKSICYVTMNPHHKLVREHIRAGGRACAIEDGVNGQMIALYDRGAQIPLVWTHLIPATLEGRAKHNVQNAMFAAAMAFSLGIKLDAIRQGLRTFDSTFFQAPGRMNVFNEHPFKVLFDYGHNAHAVGAMADLASQLDVAGRRIVVLAGPGRPPRRGPRRDRERRCGPLRSLRLPPRRRAARARARRGAAHPGGGAAGRGRARHGDLDHPGRAGSDRRGAEDGPAGRPAADLRGRAGALVEADHEVPGGRWRPRARSLGGDRRAVCGGSGTRRGGRRREPDLGWPPRRGAGRARSRTCRRRRLGCAGAEPAGGRRERRGPTLVQPRGPDPRRARRALRARGRRLT
jgi:cyanophycin synthetase